MADRLHFSPVVRLACQTAVSGDVTVRRLVLDPEDAEMVSQLKPGVAREPQSVGTERDIVILFADIAGFTELVEHVPPYDVVHVLNRFFRTMARVIDEHGGEVENVMGDGLMALFPIEGSPRQAALQAVRSGVGMLAALDELNSYVETIMKRRLDVRIGLHCGSAVLGTVGEGKARRLSVIGDSVNFASRVEAANKEAGTRFLVSEDMYWLVQDAAEFGKTVRLSLPGKVGEHTLYEVTGLTASG